MRKYSTLVFLSLISTMGLAQSETRISSIDFVQIQNDNHEEALYYYQNNWRWLRELAVKKGYISDYEFMQVERTEETPYDIILITIYSDKEQAALREDYFAELIELKGSLRLLNDKQPSEFRKLLDGHHDAFHLSK